MQVIIFFLYAFVGVAIALPYCFLAGWSAKSFLWVAFVAPAFAYVWLMAATLAGVVTQDYRGKIGFNWRSAFGKRDRHVQSMGIHFFWAWTVYSFLPVIAHWSAMLLSTIGYETIGSVIEANRYASPLYVFMVVLFLAIVTETGSRAWDAFRKLSRSD